MKRKTRMTITLVVLGTSFAVAKGLWAADWPAYRHDLARSGVTEDGLSLPLHPQWVYTAAHPPRPAWPEPGRELNRLAFDYAYEVTAAGSTASLRRTVPSCGGSKGGPETNGCSATSR